MIVGQGPIALAVGVSGGCLDIFTLLYLFTPLSPSLRETAGYRLKYCFKGPLKNNQPTNPSRTSVVAPQCYMLRLYIYGLQLLLLYCCFTSTVNIYGHVGTVS